MAVIAISQHGEFMIFIFGAFVIIFLLLIVSYIKKESQIKQYKKYINRVEAELKQLSEATERSYTIDEATQHYHISTDPLTGLIGEEVFNDRFRYALIQTKRHDVSLGIMLLDIRGLKKINEQFGHETGDKILIEIAGRLRNVIRQVDTMTRYKEDKFIFLLPLLNRPETAAYVAQRVQDILAQPIRVEGKELLVNVNIGIAVSPVDGNTPEELLNCAVMALNQSKEQGYNIYCFHKQELQLKGKREIAISKFLRTENYLNSLQIFYQPYIKLDPYHMECMQVIPYLNHPDLGLVKIADHDKIVANCGKSLELGEQVFMSSLRQYKNWCEQELKIEKIAIDISQKQIESLTFISNILDMIHKEDIPGSRIIFLVSEEALSANPSHVESSLSMIDKEGIQIAVGVFALGHLALQRISQLPLKYLKIDSRILLDLENKQRNEKVLSMLIQLAKKSNIKVLGEGVESQAQQKILTDLGCDIMQGSLFYKPEQASGIEKNKLVV